MYLIPKICFFSANMGKRKVDNTENGNAEVIN